MMRLGMSQRSPAVAVTLSWVAGVGLHGSLTISPGSWLVLATGFLALAVVLRRFAGPATLLVLAAVAGTAVAAAQAEHYRYRTDDLGLFTTAAARLARVELKVLDEPVTLNTGRPWAVTQTLSAEATAVETRDGWRPASGRVDVEVEHADGRLKVNQTIRVLGLLGQPLPAANPGQFDWAAFDRQRRTLASLFVPRGNSIELKFDPGPTPLQEQRQAVRQWLSRGFKDGWSEQLALLRSMLLGDRDPKLAQARTLFEDAGLSYQLGVGGLHVAMLSGVVVLLSRAARLRPRTQVIITTLFVLALMAVALPTDSGRRAVMLAVAAAVALLIRRPSHRPQLLALALWGLLVWHPLDLFNPGFQIGAVAVIGLVLLTSTSKNWIESFVDHDLAIAPQPAEPSRLRRHLLTVVAAAIRGARVSAVVWVATLPLLAYHFGETSVWAVLAGIAVLPIVWVALLAGMVKIATTMMFPPTAHAFAMATMGPVTLLRALVRGIAALPGAGFTLAAPSTMIVILYYLLLLLPLAAIGRRWARPARFAPLLAIAMIFSCGALIRLITPRPRPELRVVLLSIGAGQCAVIEPPDGLPWMFDAGSSSITDPARTVVEPFLRHQAYDALAGIVLSHGDYDHISATRSLESTFGPAPAYTSTHFRPNSINNTPDRELLAALDLLHEPPRLLSKGDRLELSPTVSADVLWPPAVGAFNSNNAGLVLRVNYGNRHVLFPADLQDPGFAGLLATPSNLSADVLIAPHHGSSESLTPSMLRAIHPHLILASNARVLTRKQRTFNEMVMGTRLYRTSDAGAITLHIFADGEIRVETFWGKTK